MNHSDVFSAAIAANLIDKNSNVIDGAIIKNENDIQDELCEFALKIRNKTVEDVIELIKSIQFVDYASYKKQCIWH